MQNDGPAESATSLIEFANAYLDNNGTVEMVRQFIYDSNTYPTQASVQKDLLYVASSWSAPSFDIWEEESSEHFFNALVSHRALILGAELATKLNDTTTSTTLSTAAGAVASSFAKFWDPNRGILVYEYGPILKNKSSYKDIAVILGILHGYAGDGLYSFTDDQVLSTAYQISTSFISVYPIANITTDVSGFTLGIPVGSVSTPFLLS
jgi:glucoamylase